ncbi:Crp/Fnr family transcriptional regulator [Sabulibacter ruber]|uniref:Crp/Fnr family transcriptional regulator n=1 Tax=Sabulibacter ruber TaxID=2811901 RepID=UPI001A972316|nr:Crp/Fnr family transcriptional regulator [Sabulibacter ruber]
MNAQPLLAYIRNYIDLTEEEETILLSRVNSRKYLKGQFVVQQGDVCRYENFVVSGCLKTFYTDQEGQEHIVMFAVENWWTSDLGSFITQTPAYYNVQCLENSEVMQFSYENLEQLYQEIPKLERFFRIILQKAYVASEKRIIQNFSSTAKERYLRFRAQYPQIEQRVPQYMIASYLGITKEFLSKLRHQLILEQ